MSYGPNVFPKDEEDLVRILNTPNVWTPRSAEDQPHVDLYQWQIRECKIDHYPERSLHLVGRAGGEGRVSSGVKKFEIVKEGLLATTNSGREYLLVGSPGYNGDAMYTWTNWVRIQNAQGIVDVTDQYFDNETQKAKIPVDA